MVSDTLNKAGNAKMALDTIKKAVKSNAEAKPADDPKSKVETFIANGNWNSAEKPIKGDDLNSYARECSSMFFFRKFLIP